MIVIKPRESTFLHGDLILCIIVLIILIGPDNIMLSYLMSHLYDGVTHSPHIDVIPFLLSSEWV